MKLIAILLCLAALGGCSSAPPLANLAPYRSGNDVATCAAPKQVECTAMSRLHVKQCSCVLVYR